MIDKRYKNIILPLIPPDLPWELIDGKKHTILRINGRMAATISNRSKIEGGRAMQNIISGIKRVVRQCQSV